MEAKTLGSSSSLYAGDSPTSETAVDVVDLVDVVASADDEDEGSDGTCACRLDGNRYTSVECTSTESSNIAYLPEAVTVLVSWSDRML